VESESRPAPIGIENLPPQSNRAQTVGATGGLAGARFGARSLNLGDVFSLGQGISDSDFEHHPVHEFSGPGNAGRFFTRWQSDRLYLGWRKGNNSDIYVKLIGADSRCD